MCTLVPDASVPTRWKELSDNLLLKSGVAISYAAFLFYNQKGNIIK